MIRYIDFESLFVLLSFHTSVSCGEDMPIIMKLDRVMADRKMSLKELSEKVGVANVNLSKMKT